MSPRSELELEYRRRVDRLLTALEELARSLVEQAPTTRSRFAFGDSARGLHDVAERLRALIAAGATRDELIKAAADLAGPLALITAGSTKGDVPIARPNLLDEVNDLRTLFQESRYAAVWLRAQDMTRWKTHRGDEWWYSDAWGEATASAGPSVSIDSIKARDGVLTEQHLHELLWSASQRFEGSPLLCCLDTVTEPLLQTLSNKGLVRWELMQGRYSKDARLVLIAPRVPAG